MVLAVFCPPNLAPPIVWEGNFISLAEATFLVYVCYFSWLSLINLVIICSDSISFRILASELRFSLRSGGGSVILIIGGCSILSFKRS